MSSFGVSLSGDLVVEKAIPIFDDGFISDRALHTTEVDGLVLKLVLARSHSTFTLILEFKYFNS